MMDNFYIKLHKGAGEPFYKRKGISEYNDFFKGQTLRWTERNERRVFEIADFVSGYNQFDSELIKSLWFRQLVHAKSLCKNFPQRAITEANFQAIDAIGREKAALFEEQGVADYRVNWRLAIGLGNASVFENSLTLHHVYGVPYIPASSVKGIIRSWLIQEYFSYDKDGEKRFEYGEGLALRDSEDFCLIFGTPSEFKVADNKSEKSRIKNQVGNPTAHIGNVVFFDAFPVNNPKVYVDIMNPHYPEYYKEGSRKPPADWQNPVPIFFLTIKDTSFQFLFGIRKGCTDGEYEKLSNVSFQHPSDPEMNKKGSAEKVLKELLEEALTFNGAGAKTATGYGRMRNISREQLAQIKERKAEEEAVKAAQKAAEEEKRRREAEEVRKAEELAERRERNKQEREEKVEQYKNEGLASKLEGIDDFKKSKEIISDYKNVVNTIPEDQYPFIKRLIQRCWNSASSSKQKKRWQKKGKGDWGIVRSWTSVEVADSWFDEIIKE